MKSTPLLPFGILALAAATGFCAVQTAPSLITEGLVGHWKVDGDLRDSGPDERHGELAGSTSHPDTSLGGRIMVFNGLNTLLRVPAAKAPEFGAGDFTLALWVRPQTPGPKVVATQATWKLEYSKDWRAVFTITDAKGKSFSLQSLPDTLVAGRWAHIAVTAKRGEPDAARLYINGLPMAQGDLPGTPLPKAKLLFGGDGQQFFRGHLDEIYLFDRALSAEEVKTIWYPGFRFFYDPLAREKFEKAELKPGRVTGAVNPPTPRAAFPDRRFTISTNDTLALIGGGNFEALQKQGHLESFLVASHPRAGLRFRNVAWEGDTVYEQWRDVNYGSWAEQLGHLKADVLLVQFGQMEALDGIDRLREFETAYQKLLDEFRKQTGRIALVSPLPFEKPNAIAAPDLSLKNFPDLAAYVAVIEKIAIRNGLPFIDLFTPLAKSKEQLTRDGIHLTPTGHQRVAETAAQGLGVDVTALSDLEKLRETINEKNRLWAQYWRPMNYAFAFGDRTHVAFGKGDPSLREEIDALYPLLQTAEAAVTAVANGSREVPRVEPLAERPHSQITVLTAEEQIASFTVRDDLQVDLFASEEDGIINPVQMRWDERGRLWVLCLPTYPQVTPGAKPNDFVLVCEDTNHDGRADKFHRFVEGLYLPMGLELGDDGLYVGHGDELLHLKDTDGDGRADQRRVVLSGFGTGDSHQLINSLIWGPAGRLWFTQGHHVYSRVETPYGIEKHLKAGVWRLHPHRLRLDSFFHQSTAGANCWGVAFDEWGQVFHNTGAQYAAYYTVPGMLRTDHPLPTKELFTGSKNTCIEILGSRHLPDDLQGIVAFAGFYNNSLPVFRPIDDAGGFKSERLPDLITSTRREFRPVDIRSGPDGAIYLCDWYNEIVGHYQTSYRDPRRDKQHGRIWRVSAKNRPPVQAPNLADMNAAQLVDQLRSPERWVRYQAKRLLFHGDKTEVLNACNQFAKRLGPDDIQLVYRLVGIYEAHEELREDLMHRLLASEDFRARCYGTRMIGTWAQRLDAPLTLARRSVNDPHPRVRLEAVVASTYIDDPRAIEVVTEALSHPTDDFLDYALTQAVHSLAPRWKPALADGRLNFDGRPERLAFILKNDESADSLTQVRALIDSDKLDETGRVGLLKLLAEVGNPRDLRTVFDQSHERPEVLLQLADVSRVRKLTPSGDVDEALKSLITSGNNAVKVAALHLAAAWHTKALAGTAKKLADGEYPTVVQAAAIETLGVLQGRDAIPFLQGQASPGHPFPLRVAAVRALIPLHSGIAAKKAATLAKSIGNEHAMAELLGPLLNHSKAPDLLAKHLAAEKPGIDATKLILRVMNAAGHNAPALRQLLNDVLGSENPVPEYSADYVNQLAAEVKSAGNPDAGRSVFASPLANCVACHMIEGQGGIQGPDLSSVGTGMTVESIIESILWPRRQVKEGYLATSVTTKDDEFYQGYKLRESETELVLREAATGNELRLAKSDLADRKDAGTLMPDGLTLAMTRAELRDLVAFLAARGLQK
jgi:putative heme-binding domain-containing protein